MNKGLIIPYICTCLIIVMLGTMEGFFVNGADGAKHVLVEWTYASLYGAGDTYTEPFYIKEIGTIWFLWATFWGELFLKLLLKLKSTQRSVAVLILF